MVEVLKRTLTNPKRNPRKQKQIVEGNECKTVQELKIESTKKTKTKGNQEIKKNLETQTGTSETQTELKR